MPHFNFRPYALLFAGLVALNACGSDLQSSRTSGGPENAIVPQPTTTPEANLALVSTAQPDTPPPTQLALNPAVTQWRATLVAGDDSIPVFDNLVHEFDKRLRGRGIVPVILTASSKVSGTGLATIDNIKTALKQNAPNASEGCLIYMTSHGNVQGLYLARDPDEIITPAEFSSAVDEACGNRPTVIILSACHSGTFLRSNLLKPNRIVLTAARRDRVSFGCGAEEYLTYYDDCFLDAFDHRDTWRQVYDQARACIVDKETKQSETPSLPQAYFGEAISDLALP